MPNLSAQTQAGVGAGADGGRRPTVVPAPTPANPEISERPRRRTFTAPAKLRILKEADQAAGSGEVGAILRRHGLYSSALSEWRRQREAGTLGGLTPVLYRDQPAVVLQPSAQLRRRLDRAEAISNCKKNWDLLGHCRRFRHRSDPTAQPATRWPRRCDKGAISASCAALGISRASLLRSVRRQSRGQPYLPKARPARRALCRQARGRGCSICSVRPALIWRRRKSTRRCSMKASITARHDVSHSC